MVIKVVRINQKAESSCIIMTTQLPCLNFGLRLTFLKKNATEMSIVSETLDYKILKGGGGVMPLDPPSGSLVTALVFCLHKKKTDLQ